jgi:hypothetical protein
MYAPVAPDNPDDCRQWFLSQANAREDSNGNLVWTFADGDWSVTLYYEDRANPLKVTRVTVIDSTGCHTSELAYDENNLLLAMPGFAGRHANDDTTTNATQRTSGTAQGEATTPRPAEAKAEPRQGRTWNATSHYG